MREHYRREMNCQIVHDSWHERGFTRSYLLRMNGETAGYGSIGGAPRDPKDTLKEFFVLPAFRPQATALFLRLVEAGGAGAVEAQSNDALLSRMLHECAVRTSSETVLYDEGVTTSLPAPARGATVRALTDADREGAFPHTHEPVGDFGLELDGELVATGGLAFHYNSPYGDIYMEVAEPHRRRGFGGYLVQELKRVCREGGRIAAARCHRDNEGSRRTLLRAGMRECGRIVRGELAP